MASLITNGQNIALSVYKTDITFNSSMGSSGSGLDYQQLINSSISKYNFVPVKDGIYTFASVYGYDSGGYLYHEGYSYYKLCNCYTNIYDWCPEFFDCGCEYQEFYQQDYDSQLSYDAYGYLVNKTSGNLINQDDDEGYSYESTQYRGSSADFYNQVESTITCPYLGKSIYIPKTIRTISSFPISYSTITKVIFENNSQLTKLNHSTFANASSLSSIDFGDDSELTIIEGFRGLTGVFHNCTSLTNVDFGKNSKLKAIGGGTEAPGGTGIFSDCTSLKNIRIPSSVTKLGAYVFEGCTSLISVEFDSNSKLDTIGYSAFDECYALKNVDLSKCSKLKSIDSYVFSDCSSLENIKLPNTIEEIGYSTFGNCFSLKNINLSQCTKLKYINSSAFEKCQSLINIELPIGVEEIGNAAFYMCSSLQNINLINTKLTAIRTQSFSGCSSLTSVILPGTISIIEHYAFSGCSELRSLMCYAESVPSINISAFDGCPDDLVVFVPAVSVALYKSDFTWGQYIIKPLEELNMVEFISENEINIYENNKHIKK